jgi:hypothetical protein
VRENFEETSPMFVLIEITKNGLLTRLGAALPGHHAERDEYIAASPCYAEA